MDEFLKFKTANEIVDYFSKKGINNTDDIREILRIIILKINVEGI